MQILQARELVHVMEAVRYGDDFASLSIWPSAVMCQSLWSRGYPLDITTDEA